MVFRGFGKAKEWVFNFIKVIFMRGEKRNHENKGVFMEKKGRK